MNNFGCALSILPSRVVPERIVPTISIGFVKKSLDVSVNSFTSYLQRIIIIYNRIVFPCLTVLISLKIFNAMSYCSHSDIFKIS